MGGVRGLGSGRCRYRSEATQWLTASRHPQSGHCKILCCLQPCSCFLHAAQCILGYVVRSKRAERVIKTLFSEAFFLTFAGYKSESRWQRERSPPNLRAKKNMASIKPRSKVHLSSAWQPQPSYKPTEIKPTERGRHISQKELHTRTGR